MVGRFFLFFITISLSIYVYYCQSIIGYFALAIILGYSLIKSKKIAIALTLLIAFFYFYRHIDYQIPQNLKQLQYTVIEKRNTYSIIKVNNSKFLYYHNDLEIEEGSIIEFESFSYEVIRGQGVENLFSFSNYLKYSRVVYEIKGKAKIVNKKVKLSKSLTNNILSRLPHSNEYVGMLLFGLSEPNLSEFSDNLKNISAIQLFIVSGFHINLLASIIKKILGKRQKTKSEEIINIIIFCYLFILNFPLAAVRAFSTRLLNKLNLHFKLSFSRLDILSIVAIAFLIYEPLFLFNLSYIFTFTVCFFLEFLLILHPRISKIKRRFLYIIIPFLAVLPLTILINNRIGALNVLSNFILSPLIGFFFLCSILVAAFPILDFPFFILMVGFSHLIKQIENINFYFLFPHLSELFYAIYYILLFNLLVLLSLKKRILPTLTLLTSIIVIQYNTPLSAPFISFIDVGQGDCILIHGRNNAFNILIDTGGNRYTDIAVKRLIPYFQSKGIKKIDAVFISHNDYDHNGALTSLCENFNVMQVIEGHFYQQRIAKINFINLNHYYDFDENDDNERSQILYFEFMELNFLLMGDASKEIEEKVIEGFNKKVDVLKVGHHGSKTSTSNEFLSSIKPKIAIISCGYNNSYGHPNKDVIDSLLMFNIPYYRTDQQGSIILEQFWSKVHLRTVL